MEKSVILSNIKEAMQSGKIFTVTFIKKTTGELRTMRARMGVTKHLKGGTNNAAHIPDLMTVWDLDKKSETDSGYRRLYLDSIQSFKCGNVELN